MHGITQQGHLQVLLDKGCMALLNKVTSRYCWTKDAWHYSTRSSPGTVGQRMHGITQQGHFKIGYRSTNVACHYSSRSSPGRLLLHKSCMALLNKVISMYCSTNVAWHYSARSSPGTVQQMSYGITQQGHLQVQFNQMSHCITQQGHLQVLFNKCRMALLSKVISRYCSTNVAWYYSARSSPGTVSWSYSTRMRQIVV